jgi:predicted O-methyltransferase YrrM
MLNAHTINARFRKLPGSDKIASPQSIQGVIGTIRSERPRAILEVGTGIGTLTFAIVGTLAEISSTATVVCVETNEFCLGQLRANLGSSLQRVTLVHDVNQLKRKSFEFAIIDGGTLEHAAYADFIAPHGIILIDGFRQKQRDAIRGSGRPVAFAHVRGANPRDGAYWLARFEPTLIERISYAARRAWSRWLIGLTRRILVQRAPSASHMP